MDIEKRSLAHIPCKFEVLRSKMAQQFWTANCLVNVACAVSGCAQVTEKQYDREHDPRQLNRIIRHLKRHKVKVNFPQLDLKFLHIRAYSDAIHANNRDISSQLSIVVALCDGNKRCCIIGYRPQTCLRGTRSAMVSECHSFVDAFNFRVCAQATAEKRSKSCPRRKQSLKNAATSSIIMSEQKPINSILVNFYAVRYVTVPVRRRTLLPFGAPSELLTPGKMPARTPKKLKMKNYGRKTKQQNRLSRKKRKRARKSIQKVNNK